jgi:hypothetical protein
LRLAGLLPPQDFVSLLRREPTPHAKFLTVCQGVFQALLAHWAFVTEFAGIRVIETTLIARITILVGVTKPKFWVSVLTWHHNWGVLNCLM